MTRPTCPACGSRINKAGETHCWRHRAAPTRTAGGKRAHRRAPHRDPVTADVYGRVMARWGHVCVGPRAGLPGACAGRLELDHVLNGGMALRGPSTEENLLPLCQAHHRYKTEHARLARRLLVALLASGQPAVAPGPDGSPPGSGPSMGSPSST